MGSRIDAVVVSGPALFPIEFKCGAKQFTTEDLHQAWDYALDLKNFHLDSHSAPIFPLLVATEAARGDSSWVAPHADGTRRPRQAVPHELPAAVREALAQASGPALDGEAGRRLPTSPRRRSSKRRGRCTQTTRSRNITCNDAGARNLLVTSLAVEEVIEQARARREKAVVFLTGVPGAGKTLVGLNVATQRRELGEARAVFLSGNQPLVSVLQEALARDEYKRQAGKMRKGEVLQRVKPFIQIVHHFRDEGIRNPDAPYDHVVIFDEAQRAWNLEKTADFMKRKKNLPNFDQSEPEFLISYLDRHREWAVVICLGRRPGRIHTGEADRRLAGCAPYALPGLAGLYRRAWS
ncbi:MAG: DNA/RNA helicase domain-containing protein [Thermoanaerobaculia bacterium]